MDENDKVGGPKEREKEHNEDGNLWTKNKSKSMIQLFRLNDITSNS